MPIDAARVPHTPAMTNDSAPVLEPRHGTPTAVATGPSETAAVVAPIVLGFAVLTLIVLVVQDHQEPGVVSDGTYTFVRGAVAVAALATGAAVLGYFLRRHRRWGAFWSSIGLCVAVPVGALLALMWI